MGKLFKWMAEWKLVKAIFRTGQASGRAQPPRRGFGPGRRFGPGRGTTRPGRRL